MAVETFQGKAKMIVRNYIQLQHSKRGEPAPEFQTYIVWFSKTLRNWKALVSTTLEDGRYFEVTYNGEAGESYLDVYQKIENVVIGGYMRGLTDGSK